MCARYRAPWLGYGECLVGDTDVPWCRKPCNDWWSQGPDSPAQRSIQSDGQDSTSACWPTTSSVKRRWKCNVTNALVEVKFKYDRSTEQIPDSRLVRSHDGKLWEGSNICIESSKMREGWPEEVIKGEESMWPWERLSVSLDFSSSSMKWVHSTFLLVLGWKWNLLDLKRILKSAWHIISTQ